jgi:hypothetical protein
MEKLQKDHYYEMTEKCERIQIKIKNLDIYVIQNHQGIIIDAYGNHPKLQETGDDFLNTFTVWFDDAFVDEEE